MTNLLNSYSRYEKKFKVSRHFLEIVAKQKIKPPIVSSPISGMHINLQIQKENSREALHCYVQYFCIHMMDKPTLYDKASL